MSDDATYTDLPADVEQALAKAKRLEIITLCWMVLAVAMVFVVMGSSQAMKAAWIEDCLSFLPPIAFLVSSHHARRPVDEDHPYGFHRGVGAGHLAASVALLGMGAFLIYDSSMVLIHQEHPTIGTIRVFGHTVWLGWLMIAVLVVNNVPSVILGRMKLPLSEKLHDKILFADADMNKADWQTAAGAIVGILGIGLGLWWADSVVALAIALSIVRDGWSNLKASVDGLLDHQAKTYDDEHVLPLLPQVRGYVEQQPWARESRVRMRDQGHVMHTEVLVKTDPDLPLPVLHHAAHELRAMDWRLQDTVVVPVDEFPNDAPER